MLSPITMILRGYNLEEVKTVAETLLESRYVRNMEITLNTDNAYDIIREIAQAYGDRLNVGAGTVQTFEELKLAIEAGATFVLSPRTMTQDMLNYCKEHDVLAVPGAMTPSEIAQSYIDGAFAIKVFPSNEFSLNYANKVKEPMGDIPLMAVGGINKDNVVQAFEGGYDYIGTAGGLFTKEDIKNHNQQALATSLRQFETEVDRIFKNKE